jgi:hypothetical protein
VFDAGPVIRFLPWLHLRREKVLHHFMRTPAIHPGTMMQLYPYGYGRTMNTVVRTAVFDRWLARLKDVLARMMMQQLKLD